MSDQILPGADLAPIVGTKWSADAYTAGIAAAGAATLDPVATPTVGVMVPADHEYSVVSLEAHAPTPYRKRGVAQFFDAASFARYVVDHKASGTVIAYARAVGNTLPSVTAVLDYHAPGHERQTPGWGQHRAALVFRHSRAFAAWLGINGSALNHAAFAEFLEDHVADVAAPDGATLLELARRFEVTRTSQFASAQNLGNGTATLLYSETDAAPTQSTVPAEFMLGLAPFDGDPLYRVTARFRYAVTGGKLTITVKLHRVEDVLDQAVADRVAAIHAATGIEPFFGSVATVEAIRG